MTEGFAGTPAPIVGWAPGRVNLIGDHTDYNEGYVLPMAIHLGVRATITSRGDDVIAVTSAQVPDERVEISLNDLSPAVAMPAWASYAVGTLWSIAQDEALPRLAGCAIELDGDVPLGAGLSSSAAVECAVAVAYGAWAGIERSPRAWARIAQRAENEFVGVPTGSMDQVASMLGRAGHALFYDVRADDVEPVSLDLGDAEFVVIDTRASHALVDGGYASRRADCETACAALGVGSLRDVRDLDAAMRLLGSLPNGDRLASRARHVVTENERVVAAVAALRAGDLEVLGALMLASHASLRDDYAVSCAELDVAVEAAMGAGAWGARMTGGGFGGSAVVLMPRAARDALATGVVDAFAAAGFGSPRVIPVAPGRGAYVS